MSIRVYGSTVCPGTMRFLAILTANGVMPQFINVTGSIDHLKAFIALRDTSPLYDGGRGSGAVGFPLVQWEDGTYTRDANAALERLGIQERMEFSR